MPITFPSQVLQDVAWSTYNSVYNPLNPAKIDRRRLPGLAMFNKSKESVASNGNTVVVKYQVQSNVDAQAWERKDSLLFNEQQISLESSFTFSNLHHGFELVHDDVEAATGGQVLPNQYPRGKAMVTNATNADKYRLVQYVTAQQEAFMDKRNVNLDQLLWRSNSGDPKMFTGFDGFWPRGITAGMTTDSGGTRGYYNVGTIGGKLRSQFPDLLQHYQWLNATYSNGGTLRRALNTARYEAELRSRGRTKGGISRIICGRRAAEKYVLFMQNNGLQMWMDANKNINLDGGLPTSDLKFEGLPVTINPTFALLDQIENPTYKWDDCMILIDEDAFALAYAAGKEAVFSTPPDEPDTRVSRFSLDDKLMLLPKIPNALAIVHLAA